MEHFVSAPAYHPLMKARTGWHRSSLPVGSHRNAVARVGVGPTDRKLGAGALCPPMRETSSRDTLSEHRRSEISPDGPFEFLGAVTCSTSCRTESPSHPVQPQTQCVRTGHPQRLDSWTQMRLAMPQLPCAEQHHSRALTAIPSGMRWIFVHLRTARAN